MNLYPAIDMLGGKAVRLVKGDYGASTVYDEDPLGAAREWVEAGASYLHVVDLDGAKAGAPANLGHLRRIAAALDVPIQFGGGVRTVETVAEALAAGAHKVILGTAAFTDPAFLAQALKRWPGRVLVSVDVRGGRLATAGWTETTALGAEEVIARLHEQGANELIYTNVDRDGMLEGPDLAEVERVARAVQGTLVYSGGIGALADLHGLAALQAPSLTGVIVGKALYERRFTVAEALAALG